MASGDDPRAAAGRDTPRETELTAAALRRLEQRLDQASEAAERLIAEAAAAAMRRPPAAGWQPREAPTDEQPEPGGRSGALSGTEIELLLSAVRALRGRIPPELTQRLGEALREVLLALRALIDWYLERADSRGREPAEMRDIPIV
jgi:hypothetical protein